MTLKETLAILEAHLNAARAGNERSRHELDEAYRMLRELEGIR